MRSIDRNWVGLIVGMSVLSGSAFDLECLDSCFIVSFALHKCELLTAWISFLLQTNINNNRNNDSELDRIEQMSTNPTPPPSYNQLPSTVTAGISSNNSNSRLVMVSSERYQLPGTSSSRIGSTGNVIIVHGSSSGSGGGAVSSSSGGRRGDPPSYEDAINREEPPPSYDSLFGRVREAHKSSTGMMDFLKNVVILLLGTRKY